MVRDRDVMIGWLHEWGSSMLNCHEGCPRDQEGKCRDMA